MRRAPAALLLALLLSMASGLVPAVAPGVPLPAALGPAVALAADDVSIATAARYTVVPKAGRVRVVVDITATNEKPNQVLNGTVTRYFYDGVNLAIQPEARTVRATQDGSRSRSTWPRARAIGWPRSCSARTSTTGRRRGCG